MHVWDGFLRKVHYNALFGRGKREEKLSTQSSQRRRERAEKAERIGRGTDATLKGGSTRSKNFAKSCISITIDHRSLQVLYLHIHCKIGVGVGVRVLLGGRRVSNCYNWTWVVENALC